MSRPILIVLGAVLVAGGCTRSARSAGARAASPTSVQANMRRQVLNAVDAGEGDARLRALQQRIVASPDLLEPRLELADLYASQGYTELALEHLRIAEIRFTANADVVRRLVSSLRQMQLLEEAIAAIERYERRVDRPDASLASLLGILLDERGEHTRAESAHRLAVQLEPAQDTYRNNLGYNLQLQRRSSEAIAEFREALRLQPRSEVARNNLAFALAESGRADREVLTHWTSLRGPAAAHNNLGVVLMNQGRHAEARREFEQSLAHDRAYPPAWRNLELLSELDGRPAATPVVAAGGSPAEPSFWSRIRRGLKSVFVEDSSVLKPPGPSAGSQPRASR